MTSATVAEIRPQFAYSGLDEAFPCTDPGVKPYGSRVLVQIRTPKSKSAGGIILHPETRDTERWNTQVAKVIALGPVAFRNRETLQVWPEGEWCQPGQFIRVPKYGGDQFFADVRGQSEQALFVLFNDLDVIGEVTCDPLSVIAFI